MATELATGYISLTVKYAAAMSQIKKDIEGVSDVAKDVGKDAGEKLAEGVQKGAEKAGKKATKEIKKSGADLGEALGDEVAASTTKTLEKAMPSAGKDAGEIFATGFGKQTKKAIGDEVASSVTSSKVESCFGQSGKQAATAFSSDFGTGLKQIGGDLVRVFGDELAAKAGQAIGGAIRDIPGVAGAVDKMAEIGHQLGDIAAQGADAGAALGHVRDAVNATKAGDLSSALGGVQGALEKVGPLASQLGIDLGGITGATGDIATKAGSLKDKLDGAVGNTKSMVDNLTLFTGESEKLSGSLEKVGKATGIIAVAWGVMAKVDPKWGEQLDKTLSDPSLKNIGDMIVKNLELPMDVIKKPTAKILSAIKGEEVKPEDLPTWPWQQQTKQISTNVEDIARQMAQIPEGKEIIVGAPTADVEKALESIGFKLEHLPTGEVKVTANTKQAEDALAGWRAKEAERAVTPGVKPDTKSADADMLIFFNKWQNMLIQPQVVPQGTAAAPYQPHSTSEMLLPPGHQSGGKVSGAGGVDNVLAWLTAGEGVLTTGAMGHGGAELMTALNAGWVPPPGFLKAMLTGYQGGGTVSAKSLVSFASGVEGQPYVWGGVNWGDCSGAVSAIANYATGRAPFASRFATGSEAGELAARGFQPGLGPPGSLNVGWFNGGAYGGHTAATLPDGTNFEMGGGRGNGQFGGAAAGASNSMFTDHAFLPPEYFLGLDPGSRTYGGGGGFRAAGAAGGGGGGGGGLGGGGGGGGGGAGGGAAGGGGAGGGGGGGGPDMQKALEGAGQLADIAAGGIKETFLPPGFSDPANWKNLKAIGPMLGFIGAMTGDPTTAKILGGIGGAISGGKPSAAISAIGSAAGGGGGAGIPAPAVGPFGGAVPEPTVGISSMPDVNLAGGTGAMPAPTPGGGAPAGGGNVDNSVNIAAGGQVNADAGEMVQAAQRQQRTQQNPQLQGRRWV